MSILVIGKNNNLFSKSLLFRKKENETLIEVKIHQKWIDLKYIFLNNGKYKAFEKRFYNAIIEE